MENERAVEGVMTSNETIEQVNRRLKRQLVAITVLFTVMASAVAATSNLVERRLPLAVYAALLLMYFLVLVAVLLQARTARGMVRDYIAAQSEVERETALMAQVVHLLADGSNTPYWVWHPAGRFELHGPWAQHAGIEGHELTHDEFFETVVSRPSVEQAFREAQEQLLPVSRIVTRDLGDGEVLTTLSTFIPVRRANKDLLVMIGTSVDIDTQLKSQSKLDAAVAESKAQRAFVSALCATVGEHVGSTASAVERVRALPSPPAAADLAIISAGTRRVRQLVDDAAELYAAQAGEPAIPSEVPLAAVFDIAVRKAKRTAPPFEIEINPPLPADRPVAGDPDAVRRIFEILIHNAATLGSLDGASKATVRVHYIAGPMCKIDVITIGPKVPPLDLSYLGEPFYKGSPRERVEPSGMRLAIARALANANGAKLTLANSTSDGEGLVATIEMPLAEGHA